MRRNIIILLAFIFFSTSVFAESNWDVMRDLVKQKDYVQAEKYIASVLKDRYKDEDAFMLAGKIYTELEKYNKALIMYEKAYDLNDEDPFIIRNLAFAYGRLKKFDKALELLKEAEEDFPDNMHILLALGEIYINMGDLDKAALEITKARELDKDNPEPYIVLGDLYFAQKVYELAKNNYEQALKLDENLTNARIKLATAYYWMANREEDRELSNELFNRSLTEWNTVTKKDPKYARAWWEQGRILYFGKRYGLAAGSFKKYLELNPEHSLARWYLAQSLVKTGNCDSADTHLRLVIEQIDTVRNKAGLMLAQCLFQQEKFNDALKEYETVKLHSKESIPVEDVERMALAALKIGDTTKTINYYKEVIARDTTKCNKMYQLANLTIYMKRYSDAIYFLDARNRYCQDSLQSKVYYLLGTSYFSMGQKDTSLTILKKAIELDSNNLQARIYMADVLAALNDKEKALEEFNKALNEALADTARYRREIKQAFGKLCNLLLDTQQFKKLNKVTQKWIDYDSKSVYAWIYNGISWQGAGNKENACRSYKKGLKLDSKNKFLNKMVKKLECQ